MPYATREVRSRQRCVARCLTPGLLLLCAALLLAPTGASAGDITPGPPGKVFVERQEAGIELGRRLFFEPAASPSGRRACASCHDPDHGFSDPKRLSADDFGITTRHSQTILDSADNPSAHWDGEFQSVVELVTRRVGSARSPWAAARTPTRPPPKLPLLPPPTQDIFPKDDWGPLADGTRPSPGPWGLLGRVVKFIQSRLPSARRPPNFLNQVVAQRMSRAGHYEEAFLAAYGSGLVTTDRIARAIDAYCKTVRSTEAPVDRYLGGDESALGASAQRGLALFRGRAGCAQCHTMEGERPAFTDYAFHNTGVAWSNVEQHHDEKQIQLLGHLLLDPRLKKHIGPELDLVKGPVQLLADRGRGARAGGPRLDRHFKTPTLRDVALRPPYMHDGRLKTLEDVVRYYAEGCCDRDPRLDERLKGFEASDTDVADLVAFLKSLTGSKRPGLARTVWKQRVPSTRLRLLDSKERPLAMVEVVLEPAGDGLPVPFESKARIVRTDDDGWITFAPHHTTHVHLRLKGDGNPESGVLIPDTCPESTIELPVSGPIKFIVTFAGDADVPPVLKFVHTAPFFRGRARTVASPASYFTATALKDARGGGFEATYEGWVRSDARDQVDLDLGALGLEPKSRGGAVSLVLAPGRVVRIDLSSY